MKISLPLLVYLATVFPPCAFAQNPPTQAQTPTATQFRITGTVVDARTSAPLPRASVTIFDTTDPSKRGSLLTGDDGHFRFAPLPAGKYALQGEKRGFVTGAYNQHEQFSTAIVTGDGLQSENLVLRLLPLASLSGKIIDESGEPVRQANVAIFRETIQTGLKRVERAGGDQTDDEGYYEFSSLGPGKYFLSVTAQPWYALPAPAVRSGTAAAQSVPAALQVVYRTTYNDGVTDSPSASPIVLQAGDHQHADIHLNPVPFLHLIVRLEGNEQGMPAYPLFEKRVFDSSTQLQPSNIQPIGNDLYELSGVPAGRYSVRLQDYQSHQLKISGELDLNRDGQELNLSGAQSSAQVKLTVRPPKHAPLPKNLAVALQDAHLQVVAFSPVDKDGNAVFEVVRTGSYTMLAFSEDSRLSVIRTVISNVERPGHGLTVASGESLSAEVQIAIGLVTVRGFVNQGSQPVSGAMVILVPRNPQEHLEDFRRDQSDSDGSFAVAGVIPGSYTLIALENAWDSAWQDPVAMKRYLQRGQQLTIGELMTNAVHLPEPIQVQPR